MIKCHVVFDSFPHSGPQAVPAGNRGEKTTLTTLHNRQEQSVGVGTELGTSTARTGIKHVMME